MGKPDTMDTKLAEPCCKACSVAGQVKYFSVDKTHNMCGEACMKPSQYKLYKIFEPGLTLATDNTPCADHKFHTYDSIVTHGFGPIKMTLDLYKPDTMDAAPTGNATFPVKFGGFKNDGCSTDGYTVSQGTKQECSP